MNDLPRHPAAEIGAVEDRFFTLRNFPLTDGTVMPEATIAYETYGRLAPPNGPNGGRNAILCTHGYTASQTIGRTNPDLVSCSARPTNGSASRFRHKPGIGTIRPPAQLPRYGVHSYCR